MIFTLKRDSVQSDDYCSMGEIIFGGPPYFPTIELPWIASAGAPCGLIGHSCIGKGTYKLEHRYTEARGAHFLVSNPELGVYRYPADIPPGVYARSLILIHAANWAHELLGCIAPGTSRGVLDNERCVLGSRDALAQLIAMTGHTSDLQLEIN